MICTVFFLEEWCIFGLHFILWKHNPLSSIAKPLGVKPILEIQELLGGSWFQLDIWKCSCTFTVISGTAVLLCLYLSSEVFWLFYRCLICSYKFGTPWPCYFGWRCSLQALDLSPSNSMFLFPFSGWQSSCWHSLDFNQVNDPEGGPVHFNRWEQWFY